MEPPRTFAGLVDRAAALATGPRRLLGIAGAPGAGKSTLAARLVAALDGRAALVGMDGFHLAQAELERLGRAGRKGAPDTFDADGYADLLRRLRTSADEVVYAPEFRRDLEEPIACAVPVPRGVPLVVTEGNYLLHWPAVADLLDEVWFLATDDRLRRDRLYQRHRDFGRTPEQARAKTDGWDERNARLVAASASRADLVLRKIQ
ncbi:nucleoside/nucleotide kinase family protein [Actinokineospora bangkokensis]|uniref:Nucleoside/nucleotide kinase family protein n=1 Tax=Actinokineospora bangkokensis TaxID=1193682 RepID=A0A1Q9LFX9_9PSEU|nr:nucleoside/nucleotide kinase family protein [Actinokineospora bangkokensis]OLR90936.1 nucleoside/nucleotide kinase family protein [Actinokineospora bangkokensis]